MAAYTLKWRIPFKTLYGNELLYMNIYAEGQNTMTTLLGGAEPFTTQEDDDEDQFKPLRTHTGYFRIVDQGTAGFNWEDLIPDNDLDRPVKLTTEAGTVLWQGFMQAQDFGNTLYGNPQEREYPVQCPLSALAATSVSAVERSIHNFAYVIREAFATLAIETETSGVNLLQFNYVFQGGADARAWLLKKVDWQNFVDEDADGNIFGKYDYRQMVEDVCSFWGWTCRTQGETVYFTCTDDNSETDALVLTQAQLDALADETSTSAGTVEQFFGQGIDMSGNIFASTDNTEYLVRGFSSATVTSNANNGDVDVIAAFPEKVEKDMRQGTGYSELYDQKSYTFTPDMLSFTSAFLTGTCLSGYGSFNIGYIQNLDPNNRSKTSPMPAVRIRHTYDGSVCARFETVFQHSYYDDSNASLFFNDGGLVMNGNFYRRAEKIEDHADFNESIGKYTMKMRLGIGTDRSHAHWWNGQDWQSAITEFTATVGGNDGKIYSKVGSGRNFTTRYYIPTNYDYLAGLLFVDFLGSTDVPETDNVRKFDIFDFVVSFHRHTYTPQVNDNLRMTFENIDRDSTREYHAANSSKIRSEWNTDTIYASDNAMPFGYGVVLNSDNTQMEKADYGNTQEIPELHLANRVAAFWDKSRRMIRAELRRPAIAQFTPRKAVTVGSGSTNYYPISISHSWRDDVEKITILEM